MDITGVCGELCDGLFSTDMDALAEEDFSEDVVRILKRALTQSVQSGSAKLREGKQE